MKWKFIGLMATLLTSSALFGQQWVELMEDPEVSFYEVQRAFNVHWGNQPYIRGKGWKQYKRWEYFMDARTFPYGKRPQADRVWQEHYKFQRKYGQANTISRSANWTSLGPDSWQGANGWNPGNGRINCIAEHPTNANILYAGAPSGGLWKTTNGGSSWVCLTDDQPVLGVSAILIHPTNPDTIYIGTGDGDGSDTYSIGVLKSTDGGQTFTTTGLSWNSTNNRLIRRMIMHPTNDQILFAATNNGIYRTANGGQSWVQIIPGSMRDVEFKPGNPNIVYAASDQFYKSTNGGLTFTQVTTGLPGAAAVNRASVAVSPANPNYVYVLFGDQSNSGYYGLYKSSNSGSSFVMQSDTPNIFTYDMAGTGTGGQAWYDMALEVNPANAEEVYAGGINVWKSNNGGVDWHILTHWVYPPATGYVHADIHTLDYFGNNLYCGSDGGLFISSDTGGTWTDLSAGMEIMQFYRIGVSAQNPYEIIGGTQDNGTNYLKSNIWSHVLGADGMEAAIDPTNSQVLYGETQSGGLRRSLDGGTNWNGIEPPNAGAAAWVMPYTLDPQAPSTLYAGYQEVWKSTNQGNNWMQISNFGGNSTLRYIAVAPSNSSYIYCGTNGTLYMTANGGTSWSTITPNHSGGGITYVVVHPNNPQKVWITISGFTHGEKVYMTEDGGTTWQNVSGNLPNLPVNCIVHETGSPDGLYVGTDVGIYYTDTTLTNWQPYMTGLPNVIVNELEIHYGINKIRAASYGRGIWESDLFTPSPFPPEADFSFLAGTSCQGDSLEFTDQSLNASPGWQWQFPGGSPATSTLQHPKVLYNTAGTYTATLIVSNGNGADTITKTVVIDYAQHEVNLSITLDNYPSETTWEVVDSLGNIIANGGPYGAANTTVNERICLNDGCFTFIIYDSYGDGICCGFGNGSYTLTDSANNILADGGAFTNQESTVFCFNRVPPVNIDNLLPTISDCGSDNGAITVMASGGDSTYTYSLDGVNYQPGDVFYNVAPGSYMVYVMDGTGQIDSATVLVSERPGPTAVASASNTQLYLNQGANTTFISVLSQNYAYVEWNFGDGNTSNQANPAYTYTTAGSYTAVLTAFKDDCTDTDTVFIQVDVNSSIDNTNNNQVDISIAPNPVKDVFSFNIELPIMTSDVEISIHNMLGQQVYWQRFADPVDAINKSLNFNKQASGMYILTVSTPEYRLSRKFTKG